MFESRRAARTYVGVSDWLVSYALGDKSDWLVIVWNVTPETAWTAEVLLALFLRIVYAVHGVLYTLTEQNFVWPLRCNQELMLNYQLFHAYGHAYWVISSCGLCFCRCFLTGFDHICSCTIFSFTSVLSLQPFLLRLITLVSSVFSEMPGPE